MLGQICPFASAIFMLFAKDKEQPLRFANKVGPGNYRLDAHVRVGPDVAHERDLTVP